MQYRIQAVPLNLKSEVVCVGVPATSELVRAIWDQHVKGWSLIFLWAIREDDQREEWKFMTRDSQDPPFEVPERMESIAFTGKMNTKVLFCAKPRRSSKKMTKAEADSLAHDVLHGPPGELRVPPVKASLRQHNQLMNDAIEEGLTSADVPTRLKMAEALAEYVTLRARDHDAEVPVGNTYVPRGEEILVYVHGQPIRRDMLAKAKSYYADLREIAWAAVMVRPATIKYEQKRAWDYRITRLIRAVDGDTYDLEVEKRMDFGFRLIEDKRWATRFRLLGVDTPEKGKVGGAAATAFALAWIEQALADGVLRGQTSKADSFGRWLIDLYREDSGKRLSGELVDSGNAAPFRQPKEAAQQRVSTPSESTSEFRKLWNEALQGLEKSATGDERLQAGDGVTVTPLEDGRSAVWRPESVRQDRDIHVELLLKRLTHQLDYDAEQTVQELFRLYKVEPPKRPEKRIGEDEDAGRWEDANLWLELKKALPEGFTEPIKLHVYFVDIQEQPWTVNLLANGTSGAHATATGSTVLQAALNAASLLKEEE